jgi:hypothetical protein
MTETKNPIKAIAYDLADMEAEMFKMRSEGLKRGAWTGFSELDKLWTLKKGYQTFLIAPPHQGKSSFINEIVINLIEFSKWKIVIWSPETGSARDVYNELLWTKCKKPFIKNKAGINSTDEEAREAMHELANQIKVLDFGMQGVTVDMIFNQVARFIDEGWKPDLVIIDPYIDLVTESSKGVRDDIAISNFCSKLRRYSSNYDIHTLLAIHTKTMDKKDGKTISGEKISYFPRPTMNDIQGGTTFARKGFFIVSLWRPVEGLPKGDDGEYYQGNETVVCVVKAKPKMAGSLGECSLYYDKIANRYYESHDAGYTKTWAYDCPDGFQEREISPNNEYAILKQKQEKIKQEVIW